MQFVFVHGTGVREPQFAETFNLVKAKLEQAIAGAGVHPCYWGGTHGSQIRSGLSIPLYDQSKAIGASDAEQDSLSEWALLYEDPLIELRLLAAQHIPDEDLASGIGQKPSHQYMLEALDKLREKAQEGAWHDIVRDSKERAKAAIDAVTNLDEFDSAIDSGVRLAPTGGDSLDSVRLLVARAVVAGWMNGSLRDSTVIVSAQERDALVQSAFEILGGAHVQTKSIGTDLLRLVASPLKSIASTTLLNPALRVTAWGTRRYRHSMADFTTPGVGDIMLYQARGQAIREFIATEVHKASEATGEPVILIAHSLGGIACIDLLIESALPAVKGVVTVGSQAPYLYEIGALAKLEFGKPLPTHVPPWLNVYDRDDLLSFVAGQVMKGGQGVQDVEIRGGQPFPAAHGAYWRQAQLWSTVANFANSACV